VSVKLFAYRTLMTADGCLSGGGIICHNAASRADVLSSCGAMKLEYPCAVTFAALLGEDKSTGETRERVEPLRITPRS
jgi:hypothetical protein